MCGVKKKSGTSKSTHLLNAIRTPSPHRYWRPHLSQRPLLLYPPTPLTVSHTPSLSRAPQVERPLHARDFPITPITSPQTRVPQLRPLPNGYHPPFPRSETPDYGRGRVACPLSFGTSNPKFILPLFLVSPSTARATLATDQAGLRRVGLMISRDHPSPFGPSFSACRSLPRVETCGRLIYGVIGVPLWPRAPEPPRGAFAPEEKVREVQCTKMRRVGCQAMSAVRTPVLSPPAHGDRGRTESPTTDVNGRGTRCNCHSSLPGRERGIWSCQREAQRVVVRVSGLGAYTGNLSSVGLLESRAIGVWRASWVSGFG